MSITPGRPVPNLVLRDAVYRFADRLIAGTGRYRAVQSLLRRGVPAITGRINGSRIILNPDNLLEEATDAVRCLSDSCLFIQGPPGSGKTYTSSHVIVELMRSDKRSAWPRTRTSDQQPSLCNKKRAREIRFQLSGTKKSTENEDSLFAKAASSGM